MKKFFIHKGMMEAGNTSHRVEQVRLARLLRKEFKNVKTEYHVKNLTIDKRRVSDAVLDIAILREKIAIRLMGGIHTSSSRRNSQDQSQFDALLEKGWKIIDINKNNCPLLWLPKGKYKEEEMEKDILDTIKRYIQM